MTVSTTVNKQEFPGNDSATMFSVNAFKILDASHVKLYLYDGSTASLLTKDVDWSISLNADQETSPGGDITYPLVGSPLATGNKVIALRELPVTQASDLFNQGGALAEVAEDGLDRTIMMIQQVAEVNDRTIKLDVGDTRTADEFRDDLFATEVNAALSEANAALSEADAAASEAAAAASAAAAAASAAAAAASAAAADVTQAELDAVAADLASHNHDGTYLPLAGGTLSGDLIVKTASAPVSAVGNTGATPSLDLSTADFFTATVDQAATFSFASAPSNVCAFSLLLTNGGAFSVTWPTSVNWPGGTAPSLTASGVDLLTFITFDGGTNWNGMLSIGDAS